jgi:hypothetical protein
MRRNEGSLGALALVLIAPIAAFPPTSSAADEAARAPIERWEVRVESFDAVKRELEVSFEPADGRPHVGLQVASPELAQIARRFAGRSAVIEVRKSDKTQELESIAVVLSWGQILWSLAAGLLFLLVTALLLVGMRLSGLLLGDDGRYSNSKVQMATWFSVLVSGYVAANVIRGWEGGLSQLGGIDIPSNLLLLSGLSALTFAAAKGIRQSKEDAAVAQGRAPSAALPPGSARFFANLATDNLGRVDIADFQMIVVTILAVGVYAGRLWDFLGAVKLGPTVSLPDVDSTILATFGLGQGAYLGKKYLGGIEK